METGNPRPEPQESNQETPEEVPSFSLPASEPPAEARSNLVYFGIAAAAIIVAVAIFIVVSRFRPAASPAETVLTSEQTEYLAKITFADGKMSAATNFLGQRVIYLDARITNEGAKAVTQVGLQMEFTDVFGQVVLRDRGRVFPPAALPLKPGETREFQLFFDHIPSEWNQGPPLMTAVSVEF